MNYADKLVPVLKHLSMGYILGGVDMNVENPNFYDADLKICLLFAADFLAKTRSATGMQLTSVIKLVEGRTGKKIYVDMAYLPYAEDIEILREIGVPETFGWYSMNSLDEFDLIYCSFSIHYELFSIYPNLLGTRKFSPFHRERLMKDVPLIMGGGNQATNLEPIHGSKKGAMVDVMFVGEAEDRLTDVTEFFLQNKERIRGDKLGLIKDLVLRFDNIYYPDGYEHTYEGYNLKKVEKKYEWLPEKVKFYRSFNLKPPMFEDRILSFGNDQAARAELMISHGCSGGSCYFKVAKGTFVNTEKGPVKIENLKVFTKVDSLSPDRVIRVEKQDSSEAFEVVTDRGNSLFCDENHKWVVLNQQTLQLEEKETRDLNSRDKVLVRLGSLGYGDYCESEYGLIDEEMGLIIGFACGDGHVTLKEQLRVYMKPEEAEILIPLLDRKLVKGNVSEMYFNKDTGTRLFEWNKSLPGLESLGLRYGREEVPWLIFKSPKVVIQSFLKGLFQADGWVNREIGLTSVSEKFIKGVQKLLFLVGVDSTLSSREVKKYFPVEKQHYNIKRQWTLRIRGPRSYNKFLKEIGFLTKEGKCKDINSGEVWSGSKAEIPWGYLRKEKGLSKKILGRNKGKYFSYFSLEDMNREIDLPLVYKKLLAEEFVLVSIKEVRFTGQTVEMYDLTTEETNLCVFDCILTHQCLEGSEGGPWREFDREQIEKNFEVVKKKQAPNTFSFFSYNSNFYSSFLDLIKKVAGVFSKISIIALRTDVLSAVPDYIRLFKHMEVFKITIGVEGVSERIRNSFLNKTLSWEQLYKTLEQVFKARFISCKLFFLNTGYETEEDGEEFIFHMGEIIKMRDRIGARTSILCSVTTLVSYDNTGMQYLPRRASLNEWRKNSSWKNIVMKSKPLGLRFRFNSGSCFVFQQLLMDLGRCLTDIVLPEYERIWKQNGNFFSEKVFNELNKKAFIELGVETEEEEEKFFLRNRNVEDIYSTDIYSTVSEVQKRKWKELVGNQPAPYCLKTQANLEPKCSGCGGCPSPEFMKKKVLKRELSSEATADDVISEIFKNRSISGIRVFYEVKDDIFSVLRKKLVFSHYLASMFLREDKDLCRDFYSVENISDSVLCADDAPDMWSGIGSFDINLRMAFEELNNLDLGKVIEKVNGAVLSARILGVRSVPVSEILPGKVDHVWVFETKMNEKELMERFWGYSGEVLLRKPYGKEEKIVVPGNRVGFVVRSFPEGSLGGVVLSGRVNPIWAFMDFFSLKRKDVLERFKISRKGIFGTSGIVCKACSNLTSFSYYYDRVESYCSHCFLKGVLLRRKI